jgi:hypothetical protein
MFSCRQTEGNRITMAQYCPQTIQHIAQYHWPSRGNFTIALPFTFWGGGDGTGSCGLDTPARRSGYRRGNHHHSSTIHGSQVELLYRILKGYAACWHLCRCTPYGACGYFGSWSYVVYAAAAILHFGSSILILSICRSGSLCVLCIVEGQYFFCYIGIICATSRCSTCSSCYFTHAKTEA